MLSAKIFACGDIVNYTKTNGRILSPEMERLVRSADYSVCNFEAAIAGVGEPEPKSGPHHSQRVETINGLKEQGFDMLLLANNHIMDYGPAALDKTIDRARASGLDTIGAGLCSDQAYKPVIRRINGVEVGFVNACEAQFGVLDYFRGDNEAGYAWINHCRLDQIIISLKKSCDFVVVFAHAGLENYDIPQKEWRIRYQFLCDLGADAVVGSHPHVPQGFEHHGNSIIFYSLGNFYFDTPKYLARSSSTYSVILKLEKGKAIDYELVYHLQKDGLVTLAEGEERVDIDQLNYLLSDDSYGQRHDQMSTEAYERIVNNLRLSLSSYFFSSGMTGIKHLILRVLRRARKIDKNLLQLHLLRNEAYYYATKHALEVKCRRKGGHE